MKTAEQWIKESRENGSIDWAYGLFDSKQIKAIQLDAVKHGMTLAAKAIHTDDIPDWTCGDIGDNAAIVKQRANEQTILTARDNLKSVKEDILAHEQLNK